MNTVLETPRKLYTYSLGILGLRTDDIWLPSYPKAGSTWLRFILCNILSLSELSGATVDFHTVGKTMSALGRHNLLCPWPYLSIPRFIKTHQPFRPQLFFRPSRVVYLIRDPRDAMVSYYYFQQAHQSNPFQGSLTDFLYDDRYGLERLMKHFKSWHSRTTYVLRYEQLRESPVDELLTMFKLLDIVVPNEILIEAIERSSLNNMRKAQKQTGLPAGGRFRSDYRFARKGQPGEWRELFSKEDNEYYCSLSSKYGFNLYT